MPNLRVNADFALPPALRSATQSALRAPSSLHATEILSIHCPDSPRLGSHPSPNLGGAPGPSRPARRTPPGDPVGRLALASSALRGRLVGRPRSLRALVLSPSSRHKEGVPGSPREIRPRRLPQVPRSPPAPYLAPFSRHLLSSQTPCIERGPCYRDGGPGFQS
jgi:hypothetical protein